MSGIRSFIKMHFQQSGNGLMQIILANVIAFIILLLLKTLLLIIGHETLYATLHQCLSLSSSWDTFLQQPWTLVTYAWVHESLFSLFFQLLLLHAFGQLIMTALGSRQLVAIYLLGSIVGGSAFLLLCNLAPSFQKVDLQLLGLSGSLYAILSAATTIAPQFSFLVLLIGRVKLRYILLFLFLYSLYNLSNGYTAESTAQLGGMLLGYIYVKQLGLWRRVLGSLRSTFGRISSRRSRRKSSVYRAQASTSVQPSPPNDPVALDTILDKIADSGYESLTEIEKQQLFQAGE